MKQDSGKLVLELFAWKKCVAPANVHDKPTKKTITEVTSLSVHTFSCLWYMYS